MLKVNNLYKAFGDIHALVNVSLEIERGEFFGLLGPNGAGKSTLMNIIVGYLDSDSGSVSVDQEIISFLNIDLRKKIGYVPQEISLYLELSAWDNLKIFGELYELSGKNLTNKIESVLELVQLHDRKKDKVKDFSGGMKRRLNLAVSLLHDPPLLLCDEPTVGVDPQSRNAIFEMLNELNRNGKTIVYTTHYMEEAERLCSRMAIIDNGNIIAKGSLTELINLLDKKETVKIQKTVITSNKINLLHNIGLVTETDFAFELIPNENFSKLSKLYSELEKAEIPDQFVQISRATLEDVFLSLTGRSLRD